MRWTTIGSVVGLVLAVGSLTPGNAASGQPVGEDTALKPAYQQPKAGRWQTKDVFGEEKGDFAVKAGKNGKPPTVKKVNFEVIEQSNGVECPEVGTKVRVQGSLKLNKAIKYSNGETYGSPWITAKDKKYNDASPNLAGMKPKAVNLKVGSQSRRGQLTMFFVKEQPNRAHQLDVDLRILPSGESTTKQGWCLFDLNGKPGK